MPEFTKMRETMVNNLLKPQGINNPRLIHAFSEVAREKFIDAAFSDLAYTDQNINHPSGAVILKPLIIATILQSLAINLKSNILVIGSTNLYMATILSYCCNAVHVMCQDSDTYQHLTHQLNYYYIDSINIHEGLLRHGLPCTAPFSHIIIEGAVNDLSDIIKQQLKVGGSINYLRPINCYNSYRIVKETRTASNLFSQDSLGECDGFILRDFDIAMSPFIF